METQPADCVKLMGDGVSSFPWRCGTKEESGMMATMTTTDKDESIGGNLACS
jgi:hypothetical protein